MRIVIMVVLLGPLLLSGCIREVTDLQEEMRNQPRLYPNDSASRVLNEMKRPNTSTPVAVPADDRDARLAALERDIAKLRAQPAPIPASIKVEKMFVVVLREEEFFASGSADLTQDAVRALRHAAETLKPYTSVIAQVRVDGHTDNRRIHTNRFPSNQELSEARAHNVASYLQKQTGLPPDRFTAAGYGATRPDASNATAEGRARNRRVEITVTSNGSPAP